MTCSDHDDDWTVKGKRNIDHISLIYSYQYVNQWIFRANGHTRNPVGLAKVN